MANISVTPKDLKDGFEPAGAGNMPWQLIERGGARGLIIKGADDVDFRITSPVYDTQGLTFSEVDLSYAPHREVWLAGQRPGSYALEFVSRSSGATIYYVNVDVLSELVVTVKFYYLPGVVQSFDADLVTRKVNAIWNRSANVTLKSLGMIANPNGETIDIREKGITLNNSQHLAELVRYGDVQSANWHVYFCWGIAGDIPGETLGWRTLIDTARRNPTQIDRVAHTVAHELGHRICRSPPSHDTQANDLMLEVSPSGINNKIRRPRVMLVNRPPSTP